MLIVPAVWEPDGADTDVLTAATSCRVFLGALDCEVLTESLASEPDGVDSGARTAASSW